MMSSQEHWNSIYETKQLEETSWFQPDDATSLDLIRRYSDVTHAIIDVGAGGSTLADELLTLEYSDVTVLDVSDEVLRHVQQRIAGQGNLVSVIAADVTTWVPDKKFDLWHDRAVFHFMVTDDAVLAYMSAVRTAVPINGVIVIGVFAEDGPESCSGLPVRRYSLATLMEIFGNDFVLETSINEVHITPWSAEQSFLWAVFRRVS
jgi:2-polyprenyl-3-methyl-5-hydroxy-6-metoxy-1,4-benzoquinol methylase